MQPRSLARCGVLLLCGNRQNASEITLDVDLHLPIHRRQHDLVHQRAQDVRCLYPRLFLFILQGFVELVDPFAVLQRHRGMQKGRRSAIITVVVQTPRDAEKLRANPLGIYATVMQIQTCACPWLP
ncbi:hypothetical protein P7F60_27725 [Rhizobium sp. YJ-22]|uniref:hypothetical protein n=1 Tax=Rhizobium sp. YJ-22 TaxID=3037556 RepID=UPI002412294C|nr:hypothetical protein [Rhizobium sp. YJ-22]MDG3580183.1 hypothetical protein [Rhizobium sp. YJ-22]